MKHIIHLMANNSSVPYFKWFAERASQNENIKFSFIALVKDRPQMLDEMKERGCDCYWIKYDDKKKIRGFAKSFFILIRLFLKIRPDAVHTHLFDDSLPGLFAARIAGVKTRIITKQDTYFHWIYKRNYVFFDKFNNWNATNIHAVSQRNCEFILKNEKASPKKVILIRNGFPPDVVSSSNIETIKMLRSKYNLDGRIVIGTVSRFIEWKGHQEIIEAAYVLKKEFPNLLFLWAGSGNEDYIDLIKSKIVKYDLEENILITGWIDRVDMPSLYKCMDIYLHPAAQEPFGFAISEAFFNGVPVIASQTGSTDLVVHKKDAWIIRDRNTEDMVEALRVFLSDLEKRNSFGKEGYNMAMKNLIFERMWTEFYEFYDSKLNF